MKRSRLTDCRAGQTAMASADLDPVIPNVVLGRIDERHFLTFRLHVGADGRLDALDQVSLLRFGQPAFNLGGVAHLLFLILHLAQEELPFELLSGKILHVLNQVGIGLHEGVQLGVNFGVDFELLSQFRFFLRGCDCHR